MPAISTLTTSRTDDLEAPVRTRRRAVLWACAALMLAATATEILALGHGPTSYTGINVARESPSPRPESVQPGHAVPNEVRQRNQEEE
jgi:hypothetical protein